MARLGLIMLLLGASDLCSAVINSQDKSNATLIGHGGPVMSIAFSHHGTILASGGGPRFASPLDADDNAVILWDTSERKRTTTLNGHENWVMSVAFSPDDKLLASESQHTIVLWNVRTGLVHAKLDAGKTTVATIAFSRDGRMLACGGAVRNSDDLGSDDWQNARRWER